MLLLLLLLVYSAFVSISSSAAFASAAAVILPSQMDKKHHVNVTGSQLLKVPFSSVPESPYKLFHGQQKLNKQTQQKSKQQKGRTKLLKQHYSPTKFPLHSITPAVAFDHGGGGQWDALVEDNRILRPPLGEMVANDGIILERAEEHSVVHLISRPTQLYYFGGGEQMGTDSAIGMGTNNRADGKGGGGLGAEQQLAPDSPDRSESGQVCRVKVPTADVFYISYEDDERLSGGGGGGMGTRRRLVDVFFHCSQYWAWCCGVDCCQLDPALVFTGACVLVILCALFVHYFLRPEFGQRMCVFRLFRMHRRHHKRIIARANAQRRKSATVGGAGTAAIIARGDDGIIRKPSKTVSSGDAEGLSRHQQTQQKQRSGSGFRRIIRNSIRETLGRGHRRLVTAGHQLRGDRLNRARSVLPEIVVTEPSSVSCYSAEDEEDEEEKEEEEG